MSVCFAPPSPLDALILHNAFNDETFIFPSLFDDANGICNHVVLGEGGTGSGDCLEHVHPRADEIFVIHAGRLKVVIDGKCHIVKAKESVRIQRGLPHSFTNAHDGDTEFSVMFDPPQQHRRFFANFATTTERHKDWFLDCGRPHLLLMALVLHRYRDHLYLANYPVWLQKLAFALLAPLARLRGYRLEIEPRAYTKGPRG